MQKRTVIRLGLLALFIALPIAIVAGGFFTPTSVVRGKSAAIPLSDQLSPEQQLAQDAALDDARVKAYTAGSRSEVMGVALVVADQYTEAASACAVADCRQVEIYNFDANATITTLVNVETGDVLDVLYQPRVQPGINKRLADRAIEIATNAPEVIEALGFKPTVVDMAPVGADMLGTSCNGEHLCVGPTFRVGNQVLWAIVDLTDDKLASTYWTPMADDPNEVIEPFIPEGGCPAGGNINRDGWSMDHEVTGTDGLRVYNVTYNGVAVANNMKLIEWHADYGSSGFRDYAGCGGGGGGFQINPFGETYIVELFDGPTLIGFSVIQDFQMSNWGAGCNYRYEQHFQFFLDGRFRVVSGAFGRGCGNNSLYRPIIRMDMAIEGDSDDVFSYYDGATWVDLTTEDYRVPYAEAGQGPHELTAENYSWRIVDGTSGNGYYIEQDIGQMDPPDSPYANDYPPSRGADPFVYVTLHRPSEGDTDLGSLGSCCNDDHRQGPDQYVDGESIVDSNIVLWYVPQTDTDVGSGTEYCWTVSTSETYPCFVGPMFHPLTGTGVAATADFSHDGPAATGEMVNFTNLSSGTPPIAYEWDFGDGSPTSTDTNPSHVYTTAGTYDVELTATNAFGSDTHTVNVTIGEATTANFSHDGPAAVGEAVNFTNLTTGTPPIIYSWDFGDGSPNSTDENPSHAYTAAGTYNVELTATNAYGSDTHIMAVTVSEAAVADFSHDGPAAVGTDVNFTNLSAGAGPITYEWDFGDGSAVSTDENPTHAYADEGTYIVSLTATNGFGSDTHTEPVTVGYPADAVTLTIGDGSGMGMMGHEIAFSADVGGTDPVSYLWDFGDGTTSTDASPTHMYTLAGTYTVSLTVTNMFGTDVMEFELKIMYGTFIPVMLLPE